MKHINIAIDGPSGAGKSSLAKKIAADLGILYVDTGALYRAIGLFAKNNSIAIDNITEIEPLLSDLKLELSHNNGVQSVILNGEDVSSLIRTPEISMYASAVSAIPSVRAFLLGTQQDIAKVHSVVMDGRDIATVVLPDADVKIYLTADLKKRAERRFEELKVKMPSITYEEVYEDMYQRDKNDSTREIAPAVKADDAILLDNTNFDEKETLATAIKIIKEQTEQ